MSTESNNNFHAVKITLFDCWYWLCELLWKDTRLVKQESCVKLTYIENGTTKYLDQLKSFSRGENKNRTNWNTKVDICLSRVTGNIYLLYKEILFFISLTLQIFEFIIHLPKTKLTDIHGASGYTQSPTQHRYPVTKLETPLQTILVGNVNTDTRAFHKNGFNPVFSKKVRG